MTSSAAEPADLADGRRTERLAGGVARGALWSLGGQAAVLTASFAATPFTIRLLGPSAYGLWSLLLSLRAYLVIADLGMSTTSTRFAAARFAAGDDDGEASVTWAATSITTGVNVALAVAIGLVAPVLLTSVLHVHGQAARHGTLAARLLLGAVVATAIASSINTPQQVRLRWRTVTLGLSAPAVLQVAAAPLALVLFGGGPVTLATLALVCSLVAAVFNFSVAWRLQPRLLPVRVRREHLRSLGRYGGALALSGVATIPLGSAERFLLGHFASTRVVAYYAVAATLGSLLSIIPSAVAQPLLPALTRLLAAGELNAHRRLYDQVLRWAFLAATPAALLLVFVARPFLRLWAGATYASHSTVLLYVIIVGCWLVAMTYVPYSQLLAAGRASTIARIRLAQLVPYLVLATVLVSAFGAVGAAVAWTTQAGTDATLFALVTWRQGLTWNIRSRRSGLSVMIIVSLAAAYGLVGALTSNLVWRAVAALVLGALYGLASFRLVVPASERTQIITVARRLRSRAPGSADVGGRGG